MIKIGIFCCFPETIKLKCHAGRSGHGKECDVHPGTACRVTVSVRLGSIKTRRKAHMSPFLQI